MDNTQRITELFASTESEANAWYFEALVTAVSSSEMVLAEKAKYLTFVLELMNVSNGIDTMYFTNMSSDELSNSIVTLNEVLIESNNSNTDFTYVNHMQIRLLFGLVKPDAISSFFKQQ